MDNQGYQPENPNNDNETSKLSKTKTYRDLSLTTTTTGSSAHLETRNHGSGSNSKFDAEDVDNNNKIGLKREVGLLSAIAMIIGTMIGSGIFISPGGLLRETQSVGLSLLIWTSCGVLSTLGAIVYIELGTVVPRSGGEYAYLLEAFGEIPAFLFAWVSTILLKPSGIAIISLSFAKYSIGPFLETNQMSNDESECNPHSYVVWPTILVCAVIITIVTVINCMSVSLATKVQNVFTTAKLSALLIVSLGGIYNIMMGRTEYLSRGFANSNWDYGAIATALYSGLWAYDGWNNLNYITEEIKDPHRNLPLAIIIALPLVTLCYILVNISYLTIVTPEEIMDPNNSVGILFGNRMLGVFAFIMPLSVALSTFGAANGSQFTAGRLCYVASREGHLIKILSFVDMKRNTPSPAIIFNAVIAILMAVLLDIQGLIEFFSFTAWIFYGAAVAAVIKLRITKPYASRPLRIPIAIPVFVLLAAVFLVFVPIVENPKIEYIYALGFILFGLVLYILFVRHGLILPGMDIFSIWIQKLLQVIPPED